VLRKIENSKDINRVERHQSGSRAGANQ